MREGEPPRSNAKLRDFAQGTRHHNRAIWHYVVQTRTKLCPTEDADRLRDSHLVAIWPATRAQRAPHPGRTGKRPPQGGWLALAAVLFGGIGLGPLNAAFADAHGGHQGHGAAVEPIPEHCLFCIDGVSPSMPTQAPPIAAGQAKARLEPALFQPQPRSRRPARRSARSPPLFLL